MASVNQASNLITPIQNGKELQGVLSAILTDLAALRASVVGVTAQLDADAGVTDTTYAANNDPVALTTTT